jgi:23S rRNA (guanine2535-N1)-methyltransferase
MIYKYYEKENFEDFACGRVIYNKAGLPNFPVKLGLEIFKRCLEYTKKSKGICLYDPCCGGGYLLTTIGLLNIGIIEKIIGSDINPESIELAHKNLSLMTAEGLEKRKMHIELMYEKFQKNSHSEALKSIEIFKKILDQGHGAPVSELFVADALGENSLKQHQFTADIVITDVPYGNMVNWEGNNENTINLLLDRLVKVLDNNSVVAVIYNRSQKINNNRYRRVEKFKAGKRIVEILKFRSNPAML